MYMILCILMFQVYYHLGSFQDSLMFALSAGKQFDVNNASEYTETIICKCCRSHAYHMIHVTDQRGIGWGGDWSVFEAR